MHRFEELLDRLSAAERAWLGTIGPRDYKWTVEHLVRQMQQKTGEDVDPVSVEEYLQKRGFVVRHASASIVASADTSSVEFSQAMEMDIEQALVPQLDRLGLRLFVDQNGRDGQQYPAGDFGRIDIVATDARGDFVVIELKREAPRVTIGQLAGYVAHVRKQLAEPTGRAVVGWILARPSFQVDDQLLEEAADAVGIKVKWYRIRVELLDDTSAGDPRGSNTSLAAKKLETL